MAFATKHDKNNPDNVRSDVYVTPDLIPREQQQSKALRAKLTETRTEMNKGAKK